MTEAELDRGPRGLSRPRRRGAPVPLAEPRLRLLHAERRARPPARSRRRRSAARGRARPRRRLRYRLLPAPSARLRRGRVPRDRPARGAGRGRARAVPGSRAAGRERGRAAVRRRRVRPRHPVHVPLFDPRRRRSPRRGAGDAPRGRGRRGALVRPARPGASRTDAGGGRGTVALDARELRRLFGEPALLRRTALRFELAQLLAASLLLASALAALPPLRGHLLGLWRMPS